jgi:hypothetical protein
MTLQDLKDHFQTNVDNFHLERQEAEKYLSPEIAKTFPKKAATELLNLIFQDILSELPEITERAILSYKKDLNFKWSKEQKTKYFKKEIKKLERYYKGSPFATWFVIDEFHNEIFKEHALKNIADTYLNELGKYEFWNELPLLETGDFDFSKLDFDNTAKALKEINSELKFTFFHLIKTKVLKIEFEKWQIQNVNPKIEKVKEIDVKAHLIETIQKGEKSALETVEISMKQDFFEIEKWKINDNHYKKLLSELIAKTINRYKSIKNLYKVSNEQFEFLNSEVRISGTKELNDNDRLDFIATAIKSYLDWEPEDKEGIARKLDAIDQVQNLETIVFETKTLDLKTAAYLEILQNLKNSIPNEPYKSTSNEFEFLLGNMVDFTKDTKYDHIAYKSFAQDFCISFNRLSKQLQQNELAEWVEKIDNGFYLDIALIVDKPVIYKENKWKNNYRLMKNLVLNGVELEPENNTNKPPQQVNNFSVLEWATIFYYADETKLLPEHRFIKKRMEKFMESHNISTTFNSFKNHYHNAKKRINIDNNYPIDKLELILPFLEKNYKQAVTLIDRDISFLLSEKSEYQ